MTHKQMIGFTILCFAINIYCSLGRAQSVLTYQQWRAQQVNSGQNLLIRLSNQLTRFKATSGALKKIRAIESEQRVAARNLELLKELTIEDYLFFYLANEVDDPQTIQFLASKMSKKEVEVLLRTFIYRVRENQIGSSPAMSSKSQIFEI
jgi:hypothetical protein